MGRILGAMAGDLGEDFGGHGPRQSGNLDQIGTNLGKIALTRSHMPELEKGNCRTLSILAATWRSAHLAPPGAETTWPTWRSIHLAYCHHPPGAKPTWRPPGAETTWRPPGAQPTWPTWRMAHLAMATILCNVFKWTRNGQRILIVQMKVPGGP